VCPEVCSITVRENSNDPSCFETRLRPLPTRPSPIGQLIGMGRPIVSEATSLPRVTVPSQPARKGPMACGHGPGKTGWPPRNPKTSSTGLKWRHYICSRRLVRPAPADHFYRSRCQVDDESAQIRYADAPCSPLIGTATRSTTEALVRYPIPPEA
jgi:hypothetical protein